MCHKDSRGPCTISLSSSPPSLALTPAATAVLTPLLFLSTLCPSSYRTLHMPSPLPGMFFSQRPPGLIPSHYLDKVYGLE